MIRKTAETLAKEYELEGTDAVDFYNYIVESYVNGQRKQAVRLYTEMKSEDRRRFCRQLEMEQNAEVLAFLLSSLTS